jgi:hypothetical protein
MAAREGHLSWFEIGSHLSMSLKTQENQESPCRVGRSWCTCIMAPIRQSGKQRHMGGPQIFRNVGLCAVVSLLIESHTAHKSTLVTDSLM